MLVLSRKVGQTILVNDSIAVSIHRIRGNRVQLSIAAPSDVPVRRREMTVSSLTAMDSGGASGPQPISLPAN